MAREVIVHMVGNAHLDPVWLWHWERGSDEVLATCRAACELLDDVPEATFTRGEAWSYKQVFELDPGLFRRIKAHVAAGRWEVVNGWWVQADMNLPTEAGFAMSASMGHAWLKEHLDVADIPVGYSVDAFGHGAYLPRMFEQAGHRYYVFTRPHAKEMPLASNLFRWRSPDGHEILAYRLPNYFWEGPDLTPAVNLALEKGPRETGHVFSFFGVSDHGGGPTRACVNWILKHRDFAPGVKLEISSCRRYFAAVEGARETYPVVVGELNPHAIGCHSVCGTLKRAIRQAELSAIDADRILAQAGRKEEEARRELRQAWERICFNQFHDIFPGSAIRPAIDKAVEEVGAAQNIIDHAVYRVLRRDKRFAAGSRVKGHRVNMVNGTDLAWKGLSEFEVWMDWRPWDHHLVDEEGRVVPSQQESPVSIMGGAEWLKPIPHIIFPIEVEPMAHTALRMVKGKTEEKIELPCRFENGRLVNGRLSVGFGPEGIVSVLLASTGREVLGEPFKLICREDPTDTWGHGANSFAGAVRSIGQFGAPVLVEKGPLRTTVRLDGRVSQSRLTLFVSLHWNEPVVYLRLQTNYQEKFTVLKASLVPAGPIKTRTDRVAGGWIERATNGLEYPVHHATLVDSGAGKIGLALPDTFAADCTDRAVSATLIRNNVNALSPGEVVGPECLPLHDEYFGTDEGPQTLRFALALDERADKQPLESLLAALQRPLHVWDDFKKETRLEFFKTWNVTED